MTENKSNQSHRIRNQKMDQICLYKSHFSGEAKTWWKDTYLFIKTIIYFGGKPSSISFDECHTIKKKQEKSI